MPGLSPGVKAAASYGCKLAICLVPSVSKYLEPLPSTCPDLYRDWFVDLICCMTVLCFIYLDPSDFLPLLRMCISTSKTLPYRCLSVCAAAQESERSPWQSDRTAVGKCLRECQRILEMCVNQTEQSSWHLSYRLDIVYIVDLLIKINVNWIFSMRTGSSPKRKKVHPFAGSEAL